MLATSLVACGPTYPRAELPPTPIDVVAMGEGVLYDFHVVDGGVVVMAESGIQGFELDGRPGPMLAGARAGGAVIDGTLYFSDGTGLRTVDGRSLVTARSVSPEPCGAPMDVSGDRIACWSYPVVGGPSYRVLSTVDGAELFRGGDYFGPTGFLGRPFNAPGRDIAFLVGPPLGATEGALWRGTYTIEDSAMAPTRLVTLDVAAAGPIGFLGEPADRVVDSEGSAFTIERCPAGGMPPVVGICLRPAGTIGPFRDDRRLVAIDPFESAALYVVEGAATGTEPCVDAVCHAQRIDTGGSVTHEVGFSLPARHRIDRIARYEPRSGSLIISATSDCGTRLCPNWTVFSVPLGGP